VPANTRVKLTIQNKDATPEEFESHTLHREKIIPGNSQGSIYIGPLTPGEYAFVGEFHEDTARGVIVAQ
jgi:plastocyanin domain-containing protein